MGKRKIWYALSLTLIVISIISFVVQGLNFGIDFTGGTLLHFKFQDPAIKSEQLRSALTPFGFEKSPIQESTDGSIIVKVPELNQEQQDELVTSVKDNLGEFELLRSEKVGPAIGSELKRAALLALLVASILQILYITVRFEFKFGIAAILALLHDTVIAVGFFSLLQIEVGSVFVAAILTIIGYSINDTIVIFDRIRENMRNRKKQSLSELINKSIRQTIVRSINTSLAVIFVLLALLFLGGETTKNFALALTVGTICGAYSSIFVASPLWYDMKNDKSKAGQLKKA